MFSVRAYQNSLLYVRGHIKMEAASSKTSRIGSKATAGSVDKNELISEFQSALQDEINKLKEGNSGKEFEIYNGIRINSSSGLSVYRFPRNLIDEPTIWLRDRTPLTITIDEETIAGILVSSDREGINIGLEIDKGDVVDEASVQNTAFTLLEDLVSKLDRIRSGEISFNFDGSMKLFGFHQPTKLSKAISSEGYENGDHLPNTEQKIAILTALSQEVTYIWGPPGTGKTKTLATILNLLIKAGQSVLLVANTNAAVDEILKKFVGNKENASIIEAGKIIRLGVSTVQDESFDGLLVEKIVEKQIVEMARRTKELQAQIDSERETIDKYEQAVKRANSAKASMETQIYEHDRAENEIQFLQNRMATVSFDMDQNGVLLASRRQLLEKARAANRLRRLLLGLSVERIDAEIKSIENRQEISKLKLQSLDSELNDVLRRKELLSEKINELREAAEVKLDGMTTVESLQQRIQELSEEAENKRQEIRSIQANVQKMKGEIFKNALVIGSTIARACLDPKIIGRKFDVLIVDEASMASLPSLFFLAGLCSSHYVVSGDFRQLSPILMSDSEIARKWLERDIFTQAGIVDSVEANIDDDRLVMLREQYRMHASICALISEVVYGGKLKTPENVLTSREKLAKLPPFEGKALVFCDTATTNPYITRPKNSFSRVSPYSAAISCSIALKCIEEGEKNRSKVNVGIITPYSAQAKLITKMLDDKDADRTRVGASTIHRFQGNEIDCIVFDLVEGEPLDPGKLTRGTFKNSKPGRLMTVAISRAMGKFILVGNSEYIKSKFSITDAVPQMLEKICKTGEVIDSRILGDWSFEGGYNPDEIQLLRDIFDQTNFYDAFAGDLKRAKSRVVIFSPFISKKRVTSLLPDFESLLQKRIPIYVITRNPEYLSDNKIEVVETLQDLKRIGVNVIYASSKLGMHEKFHEKLAAIDNKVVYYGSLNILSQVNSSESMMAFRSKKTVAQLIRNFGIAKIVETYLNDVAEEKSEMPKIMQQPNSLATLSEKNNNESQVSEFEETREKSISAHERTDTLGPAALSRLFGGVEPGKGVRQRAEQKIWKMGKDLGFNSLIGYEVPNLFNDGRNRFISVIWKTGKEITVAFQIRRKNQSMDIVTSLKDRLKLDRLESKEKYIVNVSEKTGKAYFHKITDSDNEDILATKTTETGLGQKSSSNQQEKKAYSLEEIRTKHARAYESWTETEDKELISQYQENLTISEIANKHQRETSAIRSRLRKLNKLGLI